MAMAQAEAQDQIKDFIPKKDVTKINRALEYATDRLSRELPRIVRGNLTTVAPLTAGTVSLTGGSTAVVGTGTAFDTPDAGEQVFRGEGDDTWYGITTVDDATHLTLKSAWAPANDAAATYTIAFPRLALPANCIRPVELRIATAAREVLEPQARLESLSDRHDFGTLGRPRAWAVGPVDANVGAVQQIQLVPYPDARYALEMVYEERLPGFGAGSNVSGLPTHYDDVIIQLALSYLFEQEDNPQRASYWDARAERGIMQIRAADRAGYKGDVHPYRRTRNYGVVWHQDPA